MRRGRLVRRRRTHRSRRRFIRTMMCAITWAVLRRQAAQPAREAPEQTPQAALLPRGRKRWGASRKREKKKAKIRTAREDCEGRKGTRYPATRSTKVPSAVLHRSTKGHDGAEQPGGSQRENGENSGEEAGNCAAQARAG